MVAWAPITRGSSIGIVLVSGRSDHAIGRALAMIWFGDTKKFTIYTREEWEQEFLEAKTSAREPDLLAWRIEDPIDCPAALIDVRRRARLRCPIVMFGKARPQFLTLFDNNVTPLLHSSYWWLDPELTEFLFWDEIVERLGQKMPVEWPHLVIPEPSIEEAERSIAAVCSGPRVFLRVFHGLPRGTGEVREPHRYIEKLAAVRFILEQWVPIDLLQQVDDILTAIKSVDYSRAIETIRRVRDAAERSLRV